MKKIVLVCSLVLMFIFFSCDTSVVTGSTGDSGTGGGGTGGTTTDPSFSLESKDLGASEMLGSPSRAVAAPGGLKVSFRSSDIEFWATDGSFTNLRSLKYHEWDGEIAGANLSTEIGLSDSEDNVVFMPNKVKLSEYDMPEFDRAKVYDVARMDIGGGNINFTMNGSVMNVTSNTLGSGSLNANSIIFIDDSVLSETVYVSRNDSSAILNDYFDNNTLDGTYDYGSNTNFILDFVVENTATWLSGNLTGKDDAYMDVDGALFVPFEPVDFTSNSNANKVKIKLEWDLDSIFTSGSGGTYTLKETAGGTPYDFNVTIEIK